MLALLLIYLLTIDNLVASYLLNQLIVIFVLQVIRPADYDLHFSYNQK